MARVSEIPARNKFVIFGKVLAWIAAIVIAIPALLLGVVLLAGNVGPGRRLIETVVPRITGGQVRIEGLRGNFPGSVRIRKVTVADAGGIWLTVDDAAIGWSPRRLFSGEVAIDHLEARVVTVDRQPETKSGGGAQIPLPRGFLSHLRVARLDIGPAVAGQAAALGVQGAGEISAPETGEAHLAVTALAARDEGPLDHYLVEISMQPAHLHATLNVAENAHGLIAGLARLPELGSIAITASVDGPLDALATKAAIEAGWLRAHLDGGLDAVARGADLKFVLLAPAMAPGPGVGWSSIRLEGNLHGPFTAPAATATLSADGLTAAGAAIGSMRAEIAGDATGATSLRARLNDIHIPGPSPDVLAGGPLTVDATIRLAEATWPARFTLSHALFSAAGTADIGQGSLRLTVPDLAPFAAIGGVNLQGHTALEIGAIRAKGAIELTVSGGIGIAGGPPPVPALVGEAGNIEMIASLRGEDVSVSRLALSGTGFNATANGQFVDRALNLDWTVALNDVNAILRGQSDLSGTIEAHGHASGPAESLSVTGDVTGSVAAKGERLEQVNAHFTAAGLPNAPAGQLTAGGMFRDALLDLALVAEQRDGGFHFVIDRAKWKSVTAGGSLDLAEGNVLPAGKMTLNVGRLADLTPFIGRPVVGNLVASLDSTPDAARISAVITGGAFSPVVVSKAVLGATVTDLSGHPVIDGALIMDGIEAGGVRGSGRLAMKGPLDGLELTFSGTAADPDGQPARLDGAATLNATAQTLSLASLRGLWRKEPVRLLAPARIGFAQDIVVDRLRLGFRQGELALAGKWGAGAELTATLTNLPADMFAALAPSYAADGTVSGEARLSGSPERPEGTVRIAASGLRLRSGSGRALPAATSTISATLNGSRARVDARLASGRSAVTLTGTAPLSFAGPVEMRLGGSVDLAMLNPLLEARGRSAKGQLDLSLGVGGTFAAPTATGTVSLAGGDFQDSSLGTHVTSIAGRAQVEGKTIRLERVSGKAGPGTVEVGGAVGFAATPVVDLTLRASNARILATDLATALIDANLTLRGAVNANPSLGGTIQARSAEIRVPEKLPPSIVVLRVREAGAPLVKLPPPAPPPDVGLNLTLDAPSQIYIRGRGLDAELGGRVTFAGTAEQPVPQGALRLRRGTYTLGGQSLTLTSGTIDFAGGPLTNPSLNFVSTSGAAALVATLTITGDVRNPKIVLSSVPDMPQDEILSQLLFNTVRAKLNPFQVAQIAAALASLTGVAPSVGDPLGGVRSALGLDQLSVGSDASGGTALQAGRYLAPGVRLGASQSVTGGSQATVQIDIAKGLKLQTTVGTGSASASPGVGGSTNGSGLGVLYQLEY